MRRRSGDITTKQKRRWNVTFGTTKKSRAAVTAMRLCRNVFHDWIRLRLASAHRVLRDRRHSDSRDDRSESTILHIGHRKKPLLLSVCVPGGKEEREGQQGGVEDSFHGVVAVVVEVGLHGEAPRAHLSRSAD